MSLKAKLIILFLAIALIPLVFVSALTVHNYQNSIETAHLSDLQHIALFKADKIEAHFVDLKKNLEVIRNIYAVKKNLPILDRLVHDPTDPNFVAAQKMLNEIFPKATNVWNLFDIMLLGPQGNIVYSSKPGYHPEVFPKGLPARYQEAFENGKKGIYFSEVFPNEKEKDKTTILATAPVSDLHGLPAGVIVFEVNMEPFFKLIQDVTGLGKTGETLIGKKEGDKVVFLNPLRHDPEAAFKRYTTIGSVVGEALQHAVQGQNGFGYTIDYRGKPVVAAWRYLPLLRWGVVAKIDREEAFAEIIHLRHVVIILIVIISALAGITAFSIAQSISGPIQKLSKGAEIIGKGNLDYKVGTSLKDEIGQLSRAFDKMTAEQKQAQDSLRQTSFYARSLLEASLDPLVTISAYGKITDVNEATIKATGLSRGDLVGTDFSDYFTEPVKAKAGYQEVFSKGFVTDYPLTIRHKDGHSTDVLYNASVYKDTHGNVLGVFAAARDITLLKQTSQYARSLIESSLDPLVTISADGKITDVNEAAIKATGLSRGDLVGTDFSNYFTKPEKAKAGYQEVFSKGFVTDYPLTIRRKDGHLTDVLYNANIYKDTRGNVLGVFAAARDVTELKKAEAELRRHRDSLEVLVAERTADLQTANQELASSNENLEQFAYVASHDLQEPLRVMSNFSQLLEKRYKDKLDQDANEFIEFIVDAAKRMQKLITDLLAYSRIGKKDIAETEEDLNKMVQKILDGMAATLESSGGTVTYDTLPALRVHATSIMQVFQNLIGNALKFHEKLPPRVHISARKDGEEWIFSVRDNGLGIEPQYHERIFQIFQRLHSKEEYSGTGIGLSICKKIVTNYGGRIWVESEHGKGSTFYFTIPT